MTHEMKLLREMLDAENIEWHDASSPSYELPMERTHFEHRGYQWSVIHGYGSYGGPSCIEEDQGLLEIMSNAVNKGNPIGWLTAKEAMQYVRGDKND
jgi:hypothetical protein